MWVLNLQSQGCVVVSRLRNGVVMLGGSSSHVGGVGVSLFGNLRQTP